MLTPVRTTLASLDDVRAAAGKVPIGSLTVFVGSGSGHAAGIVPDPGSSAGTTHFLREDGTWAVPAGGGSGTVTSVAMTVPSGLSVGGSPITGAGTLAISTTLSGLVKGTGSGFTTASAGTDYLAPSGSGSALTGITADQVGALHALAATAVKAANYSAAAGDLVPVDTTSGNVTVTLPAAPADKSIIAVKHVVRGGSNTVSVACGGSDVFNRAGGGTTATLTLSSQGLVCLYQSSGSIWTILADDIPLAQLDTRYVQSISLATPSVVYSTPITFSVTGGAATGTLALNTQVANTGFFGPTTGADATPTFRALVAADVPNHSAALLTSGTVGTARLGSGSATSSTFLRGDQTWATVTAVFAVGGAVSGGAASRVLYADASQNIAESASLAFDGTTLTVNALATVAGTAFSATATLPAAAASTTAGVGAGLTASAAIAGTTNAGAAAGGTVTVTAGAADRLTSGNANGGDILLRPGAGIGTGVNGTVVVRQPGGVAGTDEGYIYHNGNDLVLENRDQTATTHWVRLRLPATGTTFGAVLDVGGILNWMVATGAGSSTINRIGGSNASYSVCNGDVGSISPDVSWFRKAAKVWGCGVGDASGGGTISSTPLTPTQIAADTNNYAPGVARYYRGSTDASRNITGLVAGSDGEERWWTNIGSFNAVFANESTSSTAANRFTCETAADVTVPPKARVSLVYDGTTSRWLLYPSKTCT